MGRVAFILLFYMFIVCSCDPQVQQKRASGPDSDQEETGLLDTWPEGGPELLWKYNGLGKGFGGPLIAGEGIYINAEENGKSYTVKLNLDGIVQWRSFNGMEFRGVDFSASYPGTRASPSLYGEHLYSVSGTGHLSCYDARKGTVIWTVDLIRDFDGVLGEFGYSESPVVDEHLVYCTPGGQENNIVALDRLTGQLVWSAPVHSDYFSYGTPVLLSLSTRDILAGTSRNHIHVVDRKDGKLLSSYRLEDIREGYEHCNSLVHKDGAIYFVPSEKYGQGTIKMKLSPDGKFLHEVWRNRKVVNVFEGFVIVDSLLYTTLEKRKLVGLDTGTGRIEYSVRAVSGNIVTADNMLILYGHNGTVQLFSLAGGEPELRSEFRVIHGSGPHFSFPVIAEEVMYIRRGEALMAYAIK